MVMTRSGCPSCQPSGHCGVFGRSAASPSAAPSLAQRSIVAICASVRRRSPTNSPKPASGSQGGIRRAFVILTIFSARSLTSWYVEQREGRRLARPMTRRTAFEQDRRDVLVERGRRTAHFRVRRRLAAGELHPLTTSAPATVRTRALITEQAPATVRPCAHRSASGPTSSPVRQGVSSPGSSG